MRKEEREGEGERKKIVIKLFKRYIDTLKKFIAR